MAQTHEVLHGDETKAFVDAGYVGVEKRTELAKAQAEGKLRSDIEWNVAKRRSTITKKAEGTLQGFGQERGPALQLVRSGQLGYGQ